MVIFDYQLSKVEKRSKDKDMAEEANRGITSTTTTTTATTSTLNTSFSHYNMTSVDRSHFGHHLEKQFAQVIAFTFLSIIIISVICNVILISSILFIRRLHSVLHVFVVNMAVSDLITSLGTIPFDVDYLLRGHFPHGRFACGVMQTVFLISLPSSVLSLTLLTAERFVAVVYPFKVSTYE